MDKNIVNTMNHFFQELEDMVNFINNAKNEISQVGQNEINNTYIANATNQLDAIILSTDKASNQIMEAAEDIEGIASKLDNDTENKITCAVTKIFEACSFQDLTGQRITKVVEALQHIETRVENLIKTFDNEYNYAKDHDKKSNKSNNIKEPLDIDNEASLLNGPQHPNQTPTQEDIDSLFENE